MQLFAHALIWNRNRTILRNLFVIDFYFPLCSTRLTDCTLFQQFVIQVRNKIYNIFNDVAGTIIYVIVHYTTVAEKGRRFSFTAVSKSYYFDLILFSFIEVSKLHHFQINSASWPLYYTIDSMY